MFGVARCSLSWVTTSAARVSYSSWIRAGIGHLCSEKAVCLSSHETWGYVFEIKHLKKMLPWWFSSWRPVFRGRGREKWDAKSAGWRPIPGFCRPQPSLRSGVRTGAARPMHGFGADSGSAGGRRAGRRTGAGRGRPDAAPFKDFSHRTVRPPEPGAKKRITVQIAPTAPPATAARPQAASVGARPPGRGLPRVRGGSAGSGRPCRRRWRPAGRGGWNRR